MVVKLGDCLFGVSVLWGFVLVVGTDDCLRWKDGEGIGGGMLGMGMGLARAGRTNE